MSYGTSWGCKFCDLCGCNLSGCLHTRNAKWGTFQKNDITTFLLLTRPSIIIYLRKSTGLLWKEHIIHTMVKSSLLTWIIEHYWVAETLYFQTQKQNQFLAQQWSILILSWLKAHVPKLPRVYLLRHCHFSRSSLYLSSQKSHSVSRSDHITNQTIEVVDWCHVEFMFVSQGASIFITFLIVDSWSLWESYRHKFWRCRWNIFWTSSLLGSRQPANYSPFKLPIHTLLFSKSCL